MMKSFSTSEVLTSSWNLFKGNWQGMLVVFAAFLVVSIVPGILSQIFSKSVPLFSILISLVSWVLSVAMGLGLVKVALDVVDGKKAEVEGLFFALKDISLIGKYLLSSILFGFAFVPVLLIILAVALVSGALGQQESTILMFVAGVVLIFGAIFVSIRLQFWMYILVEKGTWGMDALKASWEFSKGMVLKLTLFAIVIALLNLAGMLLLVVGLLITVPVTMLAMAGVYRKLSQGQAVSN